MNGDLHLHSRFSDGSQSVEDILVLAKKRGLDYVSIVDHDSVAATAKALSLGPRLGIRVIPGVEISGYDYNRSRKVHVLGYSYSLPATAITELCDPILRARHANTLWQLEQLANASYEISLESVMEAAGSPIVLYEQHIMLALKARGYTDSIYSELYQKLFDSGGICARDIDYVSAQDAVRAIKADGGYAVVAHPGLLDSYEIVEELVELGLDGIEYHPESYGPLGYEKVRELADRFGLFVTGGSNDHGTFGSARAIGSFQAPIGVVEKLAPTLSRAPGANKSDELAAEILPLVNEAADLARRGVLERGPARSKSDDHRDLVTEYDVAIEQLLVHRLGERFPGHAFLTEEETGMAATLDSPTWIIDPIDGTTNFAMMGRDFAVCVGHYDTGRARLGIVYDVMADDLYIAGRGEGAWLNGARLRANDDATDLSGCLLDASVNSIHLARNKYGADIPALAPRVKGFRDYGSSAISLCRVATGQLDAYISMKIALWDYAAAAHIVQEAGGTVLVGPALTEGEDSIRARHLVIGAGAAPVAWELAHYIVGDRARELFSEL